MIRFCDSEVCCILYSDLDRGVVRKYFFQNHINEIVCVVDQEGRYKGKITYYSLINADNIYDAVIEDYVVLDKDIWQNAGYFFSHYKVGVNEHVLLPVVDKEGYLICFAYEDIEADREIRMLRELTENRDALQFPDIFPEYKCVKIYGCNELAYFFARYLEIFNISVQVFGYHWKELYKGTNCLELDYQCMTIYAEGVGQKKSDWIDNLLTSVSVEFESIDTIYETNIKNNIFNDAKTSCNDLFSRLRGEEEIIILGTGHEALDVYDFLVGIGIDICCFVSEREEECSHKLFGKEILSSLNARNKYKNSIFIECLTKHSAWGVGGTDHYDYMGYRRNERYYLIKDYIDITSNSLLNVLIDKKVALLGDIDLCACLFEYFIQKMVAVKGYLDVLQQNDRQSRMPKIKAETLDKDTICLIVVPEFMEQKTMQDNKRDRLAIYLKENGLDSYSDYFSYMTAFIEVESQHRVKYTKETLMPKKIVLGSIEANCGNTFFRGIFDSHPSVLMINYTNDYCNFNNHLFWLCVRLAMVEPKQILSVFWQICEEEDVLTGIFHDVVAFQNKMEQLLEFGKKYTSQELFVIFHIAFVYMNGRNIPQTGIKDYVIYWEPHYIPRVVEEEYAKWLGTEMVKCGIINIVRNIITRNGGVKLFLQGSGKGKMRAYDFALNYPAIEKKVYLWSDRLVVKFEDLKCNPKVTLAEICDRWGIIWSDTLMMTTCNGDKAVYDNGEHKISDFDLRPIYNMNERFLSELDRLRIMLINAPWQKKYGYSYVEITSFTRRELQEIFLKKFRFEDMVEFQNERLRREFKIQLYKTIRNNLQKVRMMEVMGTIEDL